MLATNGEGWHGRNSLFYGLHIVPPDAPCFLLRRRYRRGHASSQGHRYRDKRQRQKVQAQTIEMPGGELLTGDFCERWIRVVTCCAKNADLVCDWPTQHHRSQGRRQKVKTQFVDRTL